ncbi:MAG: hypothetical protein IPJ71_06660 [Bdellovibrionales bacterium]|nr:hypothetical protein [Bdellovibrionales bacterium]
MEINPTAIFLEISNLPAAKISTNINFKVLALTYAVWTISGLLLIMSFIELRAYYERMIRFRNEFMRESVYKIKSRIATIFQRKKRPKIQEFSRADWLLSRNELKNLQIPSAHSKNEGTKTTALELRKSSLPQLLNKLPSSGFQNDLIQFSLLEILDWVRELETETETIRENLAAANKEKEQLSKEVTGINKLWQKSLDKLGHAQAIMEDLKIENKKLKSKLNKVATPPKKGKNRKTQAADSFY